MSLTASQKQSYWERVQDALKMAGAPIGLADGLLYKVESLTKEQQELFYHAEPLDVARDLSGVERWSDAQIRAYIEQSSRVNKSNNELTAPITAESKGEPFSFLPVFMIALSLTFSAVVLVIVVTLRQTEPLTRTLSILTGGVAAFHFLAALMLLILGIRLPAYKDTTRLQKELQRLEGEMKATLAQHQRLEEEMKGTLAQHQRLEEEMKEALATMATPSHKPGFSER